MSNIKVFLLNPLAQIGKTHIHFTRDWCGGEFPASVIFPPFDLATTAALLKANGVETALLDASALHLKHSDVIPIIVKEKPDYIGIISAWGSLHDDIFLAKLIKQHYSQVKVVLAGPNVTLLAESILEVPAIDYLILGEMEKPFLDLVKGDLSKNLAYCRNGEKIIKERELLDDLDTLPYGDREHMPNFLYQSGFIPRNPFTVMMMSRGCAHSCSFCPVKIWYPQKVRFRSLANVIGEVEEIIYKYKISQINFRDATITGNRCYIQEFCEELIRRKLKVAWRGFSRVDEVDFELLKLMHRAGCNQLSYGVENKSQDILDDNLKETKIDQIRKTVELTKKSGIETCCSFLLGMRGDTEESIQETIDFSLELEPDYAQFSIAVQGKYPPEYLEECLGEATDVSTSAKSQNDGGFRWFKYRLIPESENLSEDYLNRMLRQAYSKFYLRAGYILRQVVKFRSPRRFWLIIKSGMEMFWKSIWNR
ncbi:MAG: radical SAM protein [PVC group bacterium]|nr:radical SAM protein [PVC group bacterium]